MAMKVLGLRGITLTTGTQRAFGVIGAAAFLAGYGLAVIAGLWFPDNGALVATLVIVGLVVGAMNLTSREIVPYLVAALALILIGNTQAFTALNLAVDGLGERLNGIVRMMAVFTAPAAVLQALRAGMLLARPGESKDQTR